MSRRPDRVGDAIHQAIAEMLLKEIKDPRVGMVTLTGVQVTPDLRHARVFFSVIGDDAARARSLAGLESARGYIRSHLARHMKLRVAPDIEFKLDPSFERADTVSRLLREGTDPPSEDADEDADE